MKWICPNCRAITKSENTWDKKICENCGKGVLNNKKKGKFKSEEK